MLNRIIEFSLRQRLMIVSLALLVLVIGLVFIPHIPVDVFPDLTRPTITIATETPGFAAEEVEKLVTLPIENVMNGLPGAQRVRSISKIGVSLVFVEFDWHTNVYTDRQLVTEKLQTLQTQLPPNITPTLTPLGSVLGEIMILAVHSKTGKTSPMELRTLATWVVKRRLMAVSGVSFIQTLGGNEMEYQVLANPSLLRSYGVSLPEVAEAAEKTNKNTGGGFLQTPDQQLVIRNMGRTEKLNDIGNGVVAYRGGLPIYIKNVARVALGPKLIKVGDGLYSERKGNQISTPAPAVLLNIIRQPNANTVELARTLQSVLKETSLPPDVVITPVYDQSRFIKTSIKNVEESLRDGAILVTLVLLLFLFNFRPTLISLTAIPLSFILAILLMHLYGMTINTMTLGGLAVAIGALVDDAIIDVENVFRRLRENHRLGNPKPMLQVVYQASSEIRNSIVFATLIIALVFLPLFFLPGISGRMFAPVGTAYLLSLLASLVISLTVTPVLCYYFLPKSIAKGEDTEDYSKFTAWLKERYGNFLKQTLRFPRIILLAAFHLFALSLLLLPFMGKEFFPPFNESSVQVSLTAPPITSIPESSRTAALAEKRLLTIPEIQKISARIGRAEVTEDADPIYKVELDAELTSSRRTRDEILQEIREKLEDIPGVDLEITQRLFETLNEMLSGVQGQVVIKLFGDDLAVLREKGNEILAQMQQVKGVVDLASEKQVLVPEVRIESNRENAGRYGLSPGSVNDLLELSLQGKTVSQILQGSRTFNLFVGYDAPYRNNLSEIQNALVELPSGQNVPLSTVAEVGISESPNEILHDNGRRRIALHSNVHGRDAGSVVEEIRKRIAQNVSLPSGYFVSYEGQFKEQQKSSHIIYGLTLAVLLGMFIILYSEFGSSSLVLQIMVNLPLAVIGGLIAVFLSGRILSVASLLGFITVFGIVARNGIMMVSHFLHLLRQEGESFTETMILRGAKERLVPILMTALTAALGVLPLALAKGQTGKEILQPLSVVILGGLFSSTFLNVFVTPSLFWLFGKSASEAIVEAKEGTIEA